MDVYLIPTTTPERYELYYEAPDEEVLDTPDESGLLSRLTFGWSERVRRRFSEMLAEAEEWRHRRQEEQSQPAGWLGRMRRKTLGFIVERIAEQRLLWHLRHATTVCARIPDDMDPGEADQFVRERLRKDADHHRKWLVIDGLLLLLSAPLVLIPGPNVPGFYFTFQVVSHFLSLTGAKKGLALTPWTFNGSADLAELRTVITLTPPHRQRRFHELAQRLRLEHLPTFLEEVAAPPA